MAPSIKDVAKLAGVSIATVSRYMADPNSVREKNRGEVQKAINATGYAPTASRKIFVAAKPVWSWSY